MLITRNLIFLSLLLFNSLLIAQINEIHLANEYYQQGELEKAKGLYDVLSQKRQNISQINSNYLEVLKQIGEPKEIEDYFKKVLTWYPGNIAYEIDRTEYFFTSGNEKAYTRTLKDLKQTYENSRFQLSMVAQQFASKRMYQQSAEFFLLARAASNVESTYALEMARVYSLLNDKESMVDEYLNYARENRQNTAYIKNIFQNLLNEEEDLAYLENTLIKKIQQNPDERTFPDLMIWLELQRKNFYGAFVQARALDKREKTTGNQTMNVGRIAMDNENWDDAITIFEYLTENYRENNQQAFYRKMLLEAREGKVKNTFPVDKQQIKTLSRAYSSLYEEVGPNNYTFEALRNMAHLHAFYLGEIDTAAIILRHLISSPRVSPNLVSQSKMDLGDIYVLRDQPWEATLLYSQVEKANRDSPLAYEAKLKNARLHYYTGNFALAKSHLDILKRATTREIANDAIDLTVLITDNTYLDSTDAIMQSYASIELMIFQNQFGKAQRALQSMLTKYARHSIIDEVYWQLYKIHLQAGDYQIAADYLEKITKEFGYDILADDAAFKLAEITERYLNDPAEAQNLYRQFLTKYPGSMYTAEARKRFRQLRGDFDS